MDAPVRERRIRAGFPAATELAGMFLVTTAPAPMIVCGPTVTPSRIVTLEPIQTSSPIVMPTAVCGCLKIGSPGAVPWLNASSDVCAPIRTPSPIVTLPRTAANGLIVESAPSAM